jgi:hypothetical protein
METTAMTVTELVRRWWVRRWTRKLGREGDPHRSEMAGLRETITMLQKRQEALSRHQRDRTRGVS